MIELFDRELNDIKQQANDENLRTQSSATVFCFSLFFLTTLKGQVAIRSFPPPPLFLAKNHLKITSRQ